MGGEGFTPEQIAEAEADFERRLGISLTGACPAWCRPALRCAVLCSSVGGCATCVHARAAWLLPA